MQPRSRRRKPLHSKIGCAGGDVGAITNYTYEIAQSAAIDENGLEEIASLIAQMIYQSTIRKDEVNEESLPDSF